LQLFNLRHCGTSWQLLRQGNKFSVALNRLPPQQPVPRPVILLEPMLLILFPGGSRLGHRAWNERRAPSES